MARLDSFLRLVVDQKASDLHFHSGNPPIIRHHNDMVPLPFRVLSEAEARRFILETMTSEQRARFENDQEIDYIYVLDGVGRFRANAFIQRNGMSIVFRVIPSRPPTIDDLGLPGSIRKLIKLSNGLVLITGPTGSGKTTTLAAMVHEINKNENRHIITVEDPIEFIHEPLESVITQRQIGKHTATFSEALRSALREAPDVLVVGELRDVETISLALSAAETGVLVIGTLHTNTAPKAINRIIDALPEDSRKQMRSVLSVLLRSVVAQRLCKRANGDGRIAVMEILLQNWAISHMIRENKTHQIEGYLQSVNYATSGMISLDTCIFNYIRDGLILLEEGLKVSDRPEQIKSMYAQLSEED
ncbi:MAG: PilT/PilU family type 4a pilus ATPase [Proteobacteria bacterium]|nr:PilT/PilU family type 4a pilus ATPase [Pseudomonadota bacterium]